MSSSRTSSEIASWLPAWMQPIYVLGALADSARAGVDSGDNEIAPRAATNDRGAGHREDDSQ